MICKKCGAQLPENAKFCLECGTPVTDAEANQQTTSSVFDELQVEEIDSNSFFGQFENSPVEEVKPPKIEESPSVLESVNDSFSFQAEEVSDPFAITPDVTPSSKPVNNTLPNLDAENDIPINIPNPIPQTPISAAMPDLKEEVPSATGFREQAVMNSGSVNQVTMGGMSSQIVDAPIPPEEPIVNPFQNNDNVEKIIATDSFTVRRIKKANNTYEYKLTRSNRDGSGLNDYKFDTTTSGYLIGPAYPTDHNWGKNITEVTYYRYNYFPTNFDWVTNGRYAGDTVALDKPEVTSGVIMTRGNWVATYPEQTGLFYTQTKSFNKIYITRLSCKPERK